MRMNPADGIGLAGTPADVRNEPVLPRETIGVEFNPGDPNHNQMHRVVPESAPRSLLQSVDIVRNRGAVRI